jgi:RimJ/RimL family protein N-acetyltransferase
MGSLVDIWPVAGLVVRTPRLELRWPDDDDLVALARLAACGIHDPDDMPFSTPWTRAEGDELLRNSLQHHWRVRAEWTAERWVWNPAVIVGGAVAGIQSLKASAFGVRRTVSTGSWLGREFQGQGIGKEMRRAVLAFAFTHLGAERAETGAFDGNDASKGVTRALGYEPNGDVVHSIEGRRRVEQRYVLAAEAWAAGPIAGSTDVEVEGLTPCLPLFGVE